MLWPNVLLDTPLHTLFMESTEATDSFGRLQLRSAVQFHFMHTEKKRWTFPNCCHFSIRHPTGKNLWMFPDCCYFSLWHQFESWWAETVSCWLEATGSHQEVASTSSTPFFSVLLQRLEKSPPQAHTESLHDSEGRPSHFQIEAGLKAISTILWTMVGLSLPMAIERTSWKTWNLHETCFLGALEMVVGLLQMASLLPRATVVSFVVVASAWTQVSIQSHDQTFIHFCSKFDCKVLASLDCYGVSF